MKESFQELIDAIRKSREKCPWAKDQTIKDHIKEMVSEVEEVLIALDNNDTKNLKEELGDLLMDLMFISLIAEERKLFTSKELIDDVKEKLIRRKPWVFGDEIINTKEEAEKRWNEMKGKEKSRK